MTVNGRTSGDEALALALAKGESIAKAAESAGVSERTVYRRLKEPGFQARVRELRAELIDRASGLLAGFAASAVETLQRNLSCGEKAVEVRAALGMLTQMVNLRQLGEIEERVAELEAEAATRKVDAG